MRYHCEDCVRQISMARHIFCIHNSERKIRWEDTSTKLFKTNLQKMCTFGQAWSTLFLYLPDKLISNFKSPFSMAHTLHDFREIVPYVRRKISLAYASHKLCDWIEQIEWAQIYTHIQNIYIVFLAQNEPYIRTGIYFFFFFYESTIYPTSAFFWGWIED